MIDIVFTHERDKFSHESNFCVETALAHGPIPLAMPLKSEKRSWVHTFGGVV